MKLVVDANVFISALDRITLLKTKDIIDLVEFFKSN